MQKNFDPKESEKALYEQWESQGYFRINRLGYPPYCMVIPPPNVTGSLHMGHGFQQTLMDVLVRYHRMRGDDTLWVVGTDHAGIATQMVVERQLQEKGIDRRTLGREKFEEAVWEWKAKSGNRITQQMRRLGISVDWSSEHFTLDEDLSRAVFVAFEQLYDQDLIYKGKRLVNWDPQMQTAVSDLEVVNEESQGSLYYLRYSLCDDPTTYLVVATTRPETLFGDVAVAVNPTDPRYSALIGKQVKLPLTDKTIPIIADDYADPEFGTGCVKITPGHDFNDYAVGQRHKLPLVNIFTPTAHLNDEVPAAYRGLERFEARQVVIDALTAQGLIEKIEPHTLQIPRNDRGNAILEPFLTEQWYVQMQPLAERAIIAVQEKETQFVPKSWEKTYFQWLENIQDWCISRQLWWGHRIPAFYDEEGTIYIARSEKHARLKYDLPKDLPLKQDPDVLDTWFSSALWPFSTLGWPGPVAPNFDRFYPNAVLVTGFDILFFWVARMMMMGIYLTGSVPFKEVYITGLIRDEQGQKMSKTKGNVLDPIDLVDGITLDELIKKRTEGLMQPKMREKIEKATRKQFPEGIPASGTDALRLTYCALAAQGRDIRFDLKRLEGYRFFTNKLWNAARFVIMQAKEGYLSWASESLIDRWIESRFQKITGEVCQHFADYRFDLAAQRLHDFFWHDFCDWYLELAKSRLNDPAISQNEKALTRGQLLKILEATLRLLHPIMPFVTEVIWQELRPFLSLMDKSIMVAAYPKFQSEKVDETALSEVAFLQEVVSGIRNLRSEMSVSPAKSLSLWITGGEERASAFLKTQVKALQDLAKLSAVTFCEADQAPSPVATVVVKEFLLQIPLSELVDVSVEKTRLEKEILLLEEQIQAVEAKLANPHYLEKAPQKVIEKDKLHLEGSRSKLQTLQTKLAEIKRLS